MIVWIREKIRWIVISIKHVVYNRIYGMHIDKTARISFGAKLDLTYPRGIHIGGETYIASGAILFSHDFSRNLHSNTSVGKKCFIGANAIVMCGVSIGDEVIVGAGAIVTKNLPSNCIAVGNPARVIKRNIKTNRFGQLDNESL